MLEWWYMIMRLGMLVTVVLLGCPLGAAEPARPLVAVNTVCPIDGVKIDPQIPPIQAQTRTGKSVGIGVCSAACAAIVRKDPQAYVDDAVANHKHRQKEP